MREERLQLESKIKILQERICEKRDPQMENDLLILRAEFDKFSAFRAAYSILRLKQSFYKQGDKLGKLLA